MIQKVLFVLSEPDLAELLAEVLRRRRLASATRLLQQGRPAVSVARKDQPDLIVLNYNSLPDVFGAEVCRHLKLDPRTAHIPIILLSSIGWLEEEDSRRSLGADVYLSMPFTRAEFERVIDDLLSRQGKETGG